jgi:hypothetical protein
MLNACKRAVPGYIWLRQMAISTGLSRELKED